jgi:hypothetical protein
MTAPEQRRSRTAWPGPLSIAGVGEGHTHELPKALRSRYRLLMAAVVALVIAVGLLSVFVYQQQQYIEGKGEQRDRENARLEETQRDGFCDLLDTLPADVPSLERARERFRCGPGIPFDSLPPDEQAGLRDRGHAPSVAPSPRAAEEPWVGPVPRRPDAAPDRQRERQPITPEPSPAPPPLVDLGEITQPVCELVGICIN